MTTVVGARTRRRTRTFTSSPRIVAIAWRVMPLVFVALVVLGWFEPASFIGAGDVAPLVRNGLEAEAGSFWNHQMSGAGSTTADAGRVIEVYLIDVVGLFGGSELAAQRVQFMAVMVFASFGVSHLARLVSDRPESVVVAGLVGVFNPFILLHLPNLIFPLTIGVIGAALGELLSFVSGRSTSTLRMVVVSLPAALLSVNPPLVAVAAGVCLLVTAIVAFIDRPGRNVWRPVMWAAPVILAVHAFWIVPSAIVYGSGAEGVAFAAVIEADQWTWIYAENRLDRVATLTAHWGWFSPEYFPWSARLDGAPWVVMRWALPLGAVLGGVLTVGRRRSLARALLGAGLVLIVLSQGLHAPFAGVNQVLYDHVPGWWLFRDPVSKFGPLLAIVYSLLLALLVDRAAGLTGRWAQPGAASAGLLALTAIVHPWPLLNGDVIVDERVTLPSSHVEMPAEWGELSATVAASGVAGKVAVLPLNDYYQVTTTWGYHGVDIVNQVFDRPVLQRLPGGYFAEVRGYDQLLEAGDTAVLDGDSSAAQHIYDALGASHLLIRRDLVGPATDPEEYRGGAALLDGFELVATTDVGWLYERPAATTVRAEVHAVGAVAGTEALTVGRGLGAVVDPEAGSDRVLWSAASTSVVDMVLPAGPLDVRFDEPRRIDVSFALEAGLVVGRLVDTVSIDGDVVSGGVVASLDPGDEVVDALDLGGRRVPFVEGMVESVFVDDTIRLLRERRRPLVEPGPLSDCNRKDDRSMEEVGFAEERTDTSILLSTSEHSACVAFVIPTSDEASDLLITTESISGAPARLCGWSEARQECVVHAVVEGAGPVDSVFALTADDRSDPIALFVYADGDAGTRTVARYSNLLTITFEPLDSTVVDVDAALDSTALVMQAPTSDVVDRQLRVDITRTDLLQAFGPVGNCHRIDDRSAEEVGLGGDVGSNTVTLWAEAHTACVDGRIDAQAGERLIVSFDHRSSGGGVPRFCVWQRTVDSCAAAPPVEGELRYRAEIDTDDRATGLSLFIYADGREGGATVTYENIDVVRADAPRVVVEAAGSTERSLPVIEVLDSETASLEVGVDDAVDPFVLVVPESFADGWRLEGLPEGWVAEHLLVDGYANGWRIVPEGATSADLTVFHAPARLMGSVNLVSLFFALVVAAVCVAIGVDRARMAFLSRRASIGPHDLRRI